MPVVPCPHCSNPVTLPPTWTGAAYTCPHCRRVVGGAPPPPRPHTPPPVPVPVAPPPPPLSFSGGDDYDRDPAPPRRRPPTGSPVADFLTFRLMITPILIQVVFWVGTVGCVLSGGGMILSSFGSSSPSEKKGTSAEYNDPDGPPAKTGSKNAKSTATSSGFNSWSFISGTMILVFGPLLIRIACELDIILFKIHDELKVANDQRGRT